MGRSALGGSGTTVVRPARPEDGVALSALFGVLGYPCPAEEAAQRVLDLREDPNQTLLVVDVHGQLAGFVGCDLSYYLRPMPWRCEDSETASAVMRQVTAPSGR